VPPDPASAASVWDSVALLGVGAAVGVLGKVVADAITLRSSDKQAERDKRNQQTRRAVEASLELLQKLYDAQRLATGTNDPRDAAIAGLRRNAILVNVPELRDRLQVAREALEWPEAIYDHMQAGMNYLIRYLHDELTAACGAYLRGEEIPPQSEQFKSVQDALEVAHKRQEQC
jgi:hypothetical protein